MDHVALPHDPISPRPRVPLLCDENHSAGIDFLEYPIRAGWPEALSPPDRLPFWALEAEKPSNVQELETFLQSWLFFSLLRSLLGRYDLFAVEEYITSDTLGNRVSTTQLPARLQSWLDALEDFDHDRKIEEVVRVKSYMTLIQGAMTAVAVRSGSPIRKPLHQSLLAVCEIVEMAVNTVFNEDKVTVTSFQIELDVTEHATLLVNGWCPSEIVTQLESSNSFSETLYLRNLRKPGLSTEHSLCSDETCLRSQVDFETYQPRHVEKDCACDYQGPDQRQVKRSLVHGSFPLLNLVETNTGEVIIEVVPYSRGMAYLAISHVWADGLGNPRATKLPRCQLARLHRLVKSIQGTVFTEYEWEDEAVRSVIKVSGPGKLYLWCDSLCCPVEARRGTLDGPHGTSLKQLALAGLKTVYENAAYVLVLDSSLESISFSTVGPLEGAVRILNCRWMFRLWTFQEAGLAKKLLIKFADDIIDIRRIMRETWRDRSVLSRRSIAQNTCVGMVNLRAWFRAGRYNISDVEDGLALQEFSRRKLSVPTDEALCLATLLRLDGDRTAQAEPERRMETIWRLVAESEHGLSRKIMFNNAPRLSKPGYRWAPRTLLVSSAGFNLSFGMRSDNRARLTNYGLRVSAEGWKIRMVGPPYSNGQSNIVANIASLCTPHRVLVRDGRNCMLQIAAAGAWMDRSQVTTNRDENGQRETPIHDLLMDCEKSWYIIFDERKGQNSTLGLLVSLDHIDLGTSVIRTVSVIRINPIPPAQARIWEIGIAYGAIMRRAWFVRCLQVLSTFERVMVRILTWVPSVILHKQISRARTLLRKYRTMLRKEWVPCLQRAFEHAARSDDVAKIWRMTGIGSQGIYQLIDCMSLGFEGRYATVLEKFPDTQQWIVD